MESYLFMNIALLSQIPEGVKVELCYLFNHCRM